MFQSLLSWIDLFNDEDKNRLLEYLIGFNPYYPGLIFLTVFRLEGTKDFNEFQSLLSWIDLFNDPVLFVVHCKNNVSILIILD